MRGRDDVNTHIGLRKEVHVSKYHIYDHNTSSFVSLGNNIRIRSEVEEITQGATLEPMYVDPLVTSEVVEGVKDTLSTSLKLCILSQLLTYRI